MTRLLTRDEFREAIFKRDRYECVICQAPAVDAHHIVERRLWPDGGYYMMNGASLCSRCHLLAESTFYSCEEIREYAKIRITLLPPHLYHDARYDKWGNILLDDGTLSPGELFYDKSVQKAMDFSPLLNIVKKYVKHPRTYHLPWSPGATDDDRTMLSYEPDFPVVITEKMDGENTTMYSDHIHARSINSDSHESRDWVTNKWATIKHDIPEDMRICGENLYAKHAIKYNSLPSFFMVFSIWIRDTCLSWKETQEWAELFDLETVPVLYVGQLEKPTFQSVSRLVKLDLETHEGYVIRPLSSFEMTNFRNVVGKFVRTGHVVKSEHWLRKQLERNVQA